MAKGKYEYWRTPEGLLELESWARHGLTDKEIAENMGISRSTLADWCKKYPDISDTIKKGKKITNIKVENALLKRALGYRYNEEKYVTVPMEEAEYAKRLEEYIELYRKEHPEATADELYLARMNFPKVREQLVERKTKEVPPDVGAQCFWLKNRMPGEWREKQEVHVDSTLEQEQSKLDDVIRQMCGEGEGE